MTYYLAENPWYLVGILGLVGAAFLIALRVTQDGRYLTRALVALGLAAGVLIIEQLWVTDAEQIEWVVKDIGAALGRSDAEGVLKHMDTHVTFGLRNDIRGEEMDLSSIRAALKDIAFDWVHISRLSTSAGEQTHRGSAEFRVGVAGTYNITGMGARNFAGNSDWSLGFRRVAPGDWKVTRITAVVLPPYATLPLIRYRIRRDANVPNSGAATEIGPPAPTRNRFGFGGQRGR